MVFGCFLVRFNAKKGAKRVERHVHHGKSYQPSMRRRPSWVEANGTAMVEEDLLLVPREPATPI